MKKLKALALARFCVATLLAIQCVAATSPTTIGAPRKRSVASCCKMKHCCYENKGCCKKANHACCTGKHSSDSSCCCKKDSCPMPAPRS